REFLFREFIVAVIGLFPACLVSYIVVPKGHVPEQFRNTAHTVGWSVGKLLRRELLCQGFQLVANLFPMPDKLRRNVWLSKPCRVHRNSSSAEVSPAPVPCACFRKNGAGSPSVVSFWTEEVLGENCGQNRIKQRAGGR